jgi:Domain of unknown function (DUF1707)
MAAGPGDGRGPSVSGRGHLRASHADREHVIGTLKLAFVQGRLTKGELDERLRPDARLADLCGTGRVARPACLTQARGLS